MDDAIGVLQRLATAGFTGAPIPGEASSPVALVYMRWWSTGVLDVVTVLGEEQATAYRAGGLDPRRPEQLDDAIVRWRESGTVLEVTTAVLKLSAPFEGGLPVSVRPADQRAMTQCAGELSPL